MLLTPKELDRLTVFTAAELARRHRKRGLLLNYTESVAIICDTIFEEAWAGQSFGAVVEVAAAILTSSDVLPGVADMIPVLQVDAMFPDGTRLVTVHRPISDRSEP